jgi:hypothetical protein
VLVYRTAPTDAATKPEAADSHTPFSPRTTHGRAATPLRRPDEPA